MKYVNKTFINSVLRFSVSEKPNLGLRTILILNICMRLNMKMHLGRSFWVGPIRFDLKKYCFEELSSSSNFILNFELI